MLTWYKRFRSHLHPSAFLLAAQLFLMMLYAVFDGLQSERALISTFGVVVLVLVVWVVDRTPGVDWIAWTLAVPAFVLSLLSAIYLNDALLAWSALLEALLYFYAAGSLIAYMMEDYQVTTDELFAAGATFTLLAWGFAYTYLVCQTWLPGSFIAGTTPDRLFTFTELLFLSFTNLSAAGLSDILPANTSARVLLMLEQFAGVGYVAVVVSRLVGLTVQRQARKREGLKE
jgi:hypothetical protein